MRSWTLCLLGIGLFLAGAASAAESAVVPDEKPMYPHEAETLAQMKKLCSTAARDIGHGWAVTDAKMVRTLAGWDGRVNGVSITFSNARMTVDGIPADFTIIRTNWEQVKPSATGGDAADVPLSATWPGYWYYSPGTYAAAHPKDWLALLPKLRQSMGLPEATAGVVCMLSPGVPAIYPAGARVTESVNMVPLPGTPQTSIRQDYWARFLAIAGPSEKPLSPKKSVPDYPYSGTQDIRPEPTGTWLGEVDISTNFDMSKPGTYKYRLKLPFGKDEAHVAESQEVTMEVVPADSLAVHLTKLYPDKPLRKGDRLPVELEFTAKIAPLKQLSEVRISYAAVCSGSSVNSLYGSPEREMSESILDKLGAANKGVYTVKLDLAEARWNRMTSSAGPQMLIWDCGTGRDWHISVNMQGKVDGKYFALATNEIPLHVAK